MKSKLSLLIVIVLFSLQGLHANSIALNPKVITPEICDNRIDDDGDGLIDCLDPDCSGYQTCWECETEFYQVHSNEYLVSLDPYTGTYTTLGTISGATEINGAQFNPIDGHVYAPCKINGEYKLGILSSDGTVTDSGLSLPGNGIFYVGAIDAQGKMFISGGAGVHTIDLNVPTLSVTSLGVAHPGVADFALDITNGLFYGITGGAKLKVFDPYTNVITSYDLAGSINNDNGGFGACWSSNDGSFFAYNNSSGKIYTIDPDNLTATLVLNGTGNLSINDGFNCVNAPPPFESNCGNGIDDDGDGLADCDDQDCYTSNQCTVEICDNGIDDDNDGWADCSDSECYELAICIEICDNGIDDNNNGLVDGDDPQCTSSSGVTGGLESNRRLSDKIAKRNFETRVKNSKVFNERIEGVIPFIVDEQKSVFDIQSFIPVDILDAYIAESTPVDLIDITNATDVAGADYYINDQRIATVLGLYSEDGVYEHTKYVCDRLDGSRLLDISYLFSKGGNFISYELLNKYGQKEYAVSFAASYDVTQGFNIENHWNLHKYNADEDYYNFQIWAHSYQELIILLEDILGTMEEKSGINSIIHSAIPRVFVMQGAYQNGSLKVTVRNKNFAKELIFKASLRREEMGALEDIELNIPLTGASEQIVNIETGYIYDLGASLSSEGSPDDEIFLADGSWGVDTNNPGAIVQTFEVSPETNLHDEETFMVERSINLTAEVNDYLNIYRALDAKLNPQDLTQFNSLQFDAYGTGEVEITLVKSSIDNWQDQFRTRIMLDAEKSSYTLLKSQFESATGQDFILNDVNMIVFTLLGNTSSFQEKNITLENVRFQNSTLSSIEDIAESVSNSFFPNPTTGWTTLEFSATSNATHQITITDALGRTILEKSIPTGLGKNLIEMDLSNINNGSYFYNVHDDKGLISKGTLIKM